jgi:Type II secretion system (T2SS), protein G
MKRAVGPLAVAALLLAGCGQKQAPQAAAPPTSSNAPATMFTNTSSGNPLTAPADYLGALGRGREKAISTVDVASLNQAIQMFNVDEGRYPKDLSELVEKKVISKVPEAPYGLKLDYDPQTGKVTVVKQ